MAGSRLPWGTAVTMAAVAVAMALLPMVAEARIEVFIIPHSHDDPGWLSTFESYYRNDVKRILDGITEELKANPDRRFVQAEISFFNKWFEEAREDQREAMRGHIASGQLEFVGSGWVQNTEADANYQDVINQVTEGHDYVLRNFGVRPRIAWQIDPFGHNSATPELFSRLGYDALVINRIHFSVKESFKRSRHMEFVWEPSRSLGPKARMFTHVLHTHYSAPKGFDWEERSPQITDANVAQRAKVLAQEMRARADHYQTDCLLVAFGDDFKFKNARMQFENMEKVMARVNTDHPDIHMRFGTLSEYFSAVSKVDTDFPLYRGDFFPYADNEDAYWTGYYTTRPVLKSMVRRASSTLRAAEVAHALARVRFGSVPLATDWDTHAGSLTYARRQVGLVQHHDGVTGTSKSHVVADYKERLKRSIRETGDVLAASVGLLLSRVSGGDHNLNTPHLVVPTATLDVAAGGPAPVVVYNPVAWERTDAVRVTVASPDVVVVDADGKAVPAQTRPAWSGDTQDSLDPAARMFYLDFVAAAVPPLGASTFFVRPAAAGETPAVPATARVFTNDPSMRGGRDQIINGITYSSRFPTKDGTVVLTSDRLSVALGANFLASSVTDKSTGTTVAASQTYRQYSSRDSGAYIFRPLGKSEVYKGNDKPTWARVFEGPVVSEAQSRMGDLLAETRVYNTGAAAKDAFVEVVTSVVVDGGKEMVVHWGTDISNADTFFADNGMELRARRYDAKRKIQANFFPSLNGAVLRGQTVAQTEALQAAAGSMLPDTVGSDAPQLTVLTRQSHGVSSQGGGELEVMIHRHLTRDDGRGLAEPNRDGQRAKVTVWVGAGPAGVYEGLRPGSSVLVNNPVVVLTSSGRESRAEWGRLFNPAAEPAGAVPPNVHLLTLEARGRHVRELSARFYHIYEAEAGGDAAETLGSATAVSLRDFVGPVGRVAQARETSLSLAVPIDELHGMWFRGAGEVAVNMSLAAVGDNQNTNETGVFISQDALDKNKGVGRGLLVADDDENPLTIELAPMDIRAFVIDVEALEAEVVAVRPVAATEKQIIAIPTDLPGAGGGGYVGRQGGVVGGTTTGGGGGGGVGNGGAGGNAGRRGGALVADHMAENVSAQDRHFYKEVYVMIAISMLGVLLMLAAFWRLETPSKVSLRTQVEERRRRGGKRDH